MQRQEVADIVYTPLVIKAGKDDDDYYSDDDDKVIMMIVSPQISRL